MDLEYNAPTTMVEYDSDFDGEQATQQGFSSPPKPGCDTPPTPGLGQPSEISNSEMHGSESDECEDYQENALVNEFAGQPSGSRESQSIQNPSLPVMPGEPRFKLLRFEFSLASERSSPGRGCHLGQESLNNIRYNSMNFDRQKDQIIVTKSVRVSPELLLPEQDSLDIKIQQALRHPAIRDTRIDLIKYRSKDDFLTLRILHSPFILQGRPSQRPGFLFKLGHQQKDNNFFLASNDEILTLIRRLKIVLSRMPDMTFPGVMVRSLFIQSVINHLIRHSYQSFQAKAELRVPYFTVCHKRGIRCALRLNGYDFTQPDPRNASYTVGCYRLIKSLSVKRMCSEPIIIPYEEKYIWTSNEQLKKGSDELAQRLEEIQNSDYREKYLQAYRLGQQIQVTFDGYVGHKGNAQRTFFHIRDKSTNKRKSRSIYNGDGLLWTIHVSHYTSALLPSKLEIFCP